MTAASSYLALSAAWAASGLFFGLGYFIALQLTAGLLVSSSGRFLPVVLTLGRIAAAILLLGVAAQFGALPLLTMFLGFLLARALALRVARRFV